MICMMAIKTLLLYHWSLWMVCILYHFDRVFSHASRPKKWTGLKFTINRKLDFRPSRRANFPKSWTPGRNGTVLRECSTVGVDIPKIQDFFLPYTTYYQLILLPNPSRVVWLPSSFVKTREWSSWLNWSSVGKSIGKSPQYSLWAQSSRFWILFPFLSSQNNHWNDREIKKEALQTKWSLKGYSAYYSTAFTSRVSQWEQK